MDSDLELVNIVASGELGSGELDVEKVAEDVDAGSVTTHPGMLHIRRNENDPIVMLYRAGKYTIAGSKSDEELLDARDWMQKQLDILGISTATVEESMTIQYMVFKGETDENLELSVIALELGLENTEYEPEQFPAVIYKPPEFDCTVLLFSTGRLLITGVRERGTAEKVLEHLIEKID